MTPADLRSFRHRWRIKQADLARALNTTRRTLYTWESGRHPIPADITMAVLRDIALDIAPRLGYYTHPQFYNVRMTRRSNGTKCPIPEKSPTHPYKAWDLSMTTEKHDGNHIVIVWNTFTTLDGQPLDIREVAHMPSGTVAKRDGLNWIVP